MPSTAAQSEVRRLMDAVFENVEQDQTALIHHSGRDDWPSIHHEGAQVHVNEQYLGLSGLKALHARFFIVQFSEGAAYTFMPIKPRTGRIEKIVRGVRTPKDGAFVQESLKATFRKTGEPQDSDYEFVISELSWHLDS